MFRCYVPQALTGLTLCDLGKNQVSSGVNFDLKRTTCFPQDDRNVDSATSFSKTDGIPVPGNSKNDS